MVLTDGLHERALLKMPLPLRLLQLLFWSGFILSIFGAAVGLIRVAAKMGLFGLIKPPLRQIPAVTLRPVLRSFCRPKHWLTMAREIAQLDTSSPKVIQPCHHKIQSARSLQTNYSRIFKGVIPMKLSVDSFNIATTLEET